MTQRIKGTPRPASLYRGAKRNSEQRKLYLNYLREVRRRRWRDLGLAR